jgi:hypothetical protein
MALRFTDEKLVSFRLHEELSVFIKALSGPIIKPATY